jgi:hypothetical protein
MLCGKLELGQPLVDSAAAFCATAVRAQELTVFANAADAFNFRIFAANGLPGCGRDNDAAGGCGGVLCHFQKRWQGIFNLGGNIGQAHPLSFLRLNGELDANLRVLFIGELDAMRHELSSFEAIIYITRFSLSLDALQCCNGNRFHGASSMFNRVLFMDKFKAGPCLITYGLKSVKAYCARNAQNCSCVNSTV